MNIKKLWGSLIILFVAIFAFTACSSDDDDEKAGTFVYAISYSSFDGSYMDMQKISNAFQQAFGVTSTPFTLTGTQSECNRKAKECAMKAQTALANEGTFGADIEFVNTTTNEQILSFTIKKDDNYIPSDDDIPVVYPFKFEILKSSDGEVHGIQLTHLKGYRVKFVKPVFDVLTEEWGDEYVYFDDIISKPVERVPIAYIFKASDAPSTNYVNALIYEENATEPFAVIEYINLYHY